jgi:hypothetical protein
MMGAWKTSTEGGRTEAPELALGVPPASHVHFTEAANDEAKLEQAL